MSQPPENPPSWKCYSIRILDQLKANWSQILKIRLPCTLSINISVSLFGIIFGIWSRMIMNIWQKCNFWILSKGCLMGCPPYPLHLMLKFYPFSVVRDNLSHLKLDFLPTVCLTLSNIYKICILKEGCHIPRFTAHPSNEKSVWHITNALAVTQLILLHTLLRGKYKYPTKKSRRAKINTNETISYSFKYFSYNIKWDVLHP